MAELTPNHIVYRIGSTPYPTRESAYLHVSDEVQSAIVERDPSSYLAAIGGPCPGTTRPSGKEQILIYQLYLYGIRSVAKKVRAGLRYVDKAATLQLPRNYSELVKLFSNDLSLESTIWWYRPLVGRMLEVAQQIDEFIDWPQKLDTDVLFEPAQDVRGFTAVSSYVVPTHLAWLSKIFGWEAKLTEGPSFTNASISASAITGPIVKAATPLPLDPSRYQTRFAVFDACMTTLLLPDHEEQSQIAYTYADTKDLYIVGAKHDLGLSDGLNPARRSLFSLFFSLINGMPLIAFEVISGAPSYSPTLQGGS